MVKIKNLVDIDELCEVEVKVRQLFKHRIDMIVVLQSILDDERYYRIEDMFNEKIDEKIDDKLGKGQ